MKKPAKKPAQKPVQKPAQKPAQKIAIRYRSAITGRYVTEAYAKKHPTTTVRERDKVNKK
jgi:hypothetical protein